MNDAFVPLNVRQGHPHERGLINFLISLFRANGLLIILEFLLDGQVERHRRRVFEEFRRAGPGFRSESQNVPLRDTDLAGLRARDGVPGTIQIEVARGRADARKRRCATPTAQELERAQDQLLGRWAFRKLMLNKSLWQ